MPVQFIERPVDLAELCRHLRQVKRFALDTEFVTEETYTPELCLVQVATCERLAVVDPLAVSDLSEFWSLVGDRAVQVVAHAADAEIRFCRHALGAPPAPVFDVQIAAGLAGHGYPLSYAALVKRVLGPKIRDTETRTEWRQRPLSEKQLTYAMEDVHHLLELHQKLSADLKRAGRLAWAQEEFRQQVQSPEKGSDEPWRRVSGVTSLSPRQLAVMRELARWREQEAKRRNRPVRSVATDDLLRELARRQPADMTQLMLFRGMKRRRLQQAARQLLETVRRGLATPDDQCPRLPRKPEDSKRVRMLTGLLNTALALVCAREHLPPTLVASSAELAASVRSYLSAGRFPADSRLAGGWRRQLCGQLFTDLLEGKLCLRVEDPRSDMPLTLEPRSS